MTHFLIIYSVVVSAAKAFGAAAAAVALRECDVLMACAISKWKSNNNNQKEEYEEKKVKKKNKKRRRNTRNKKDEAKMDRKKQADATTMLCRARE